MGIGCQGLHGDSLPLLSVDQSSPFQMFYAGPSRKAPPRDSLQTP